MQRILLAVAIGLPLTLTGCGGGHANAASSHVHCGLVTNGEQSGKAVVTYDDKTGVPKMSAAIKAGVAAWNASGAPVVLQPSTQSPALTFLAGNDQPPLPPCHGTAPRTVTVTWNKAFWTGGGGKQEVRYPASDAEHAIGHALGLVPGGHCPELMALKACPDRATTPTAAQLTVLTRLYPSASPASSPSPSSSPSRSG